MAIGFKILGSTLLVALTSLILSECFEILVNGPDNKAEIFDLNSTSTVYDLKETIAQRFRVHVHNQKLIANGTEMDDARKALIYLNKQPLIVELIKKSDEFPVKLKIKRETGEEVAIIDVKSTDSYEILNGKIFYATSGLWSKTMKMQIDKVTYDYPTGRELTHLLLANEATLTMGPECMYGYKVTVFVNHGKSVVIESFIDYTIESLKINLEFMINFPVDKQRLFLGDLELENERKISELNIYDHPGLRLVSDYKLRRNITVTYSQGIKLVFEVYSDEKIETIRSMIFDELNVPKHLQRLTLFEGSVALRDGTRLDDHYECDTVNPHIFLNLDPLNIYGSDYIREASIDIQTPVKTVHFLMQRDKPILELKRMIEQEIGMQKERIRLFMNDLELLNAMTLDDHGIYSMVQLTATYDEEKNGNKAKILIKTADNKTMTLYGLDTIKTIKDLKGRIQAEFVTPDERMGLFCNGTELHDYQLLTDIQFKDTDTVLVAYNISSE